MITFLALISRLMGSLGWTLVMMLPSAAHKHQHHHHHHHDHHHFSYYCCDHLLNFGFRAGWQLGLVSFGWCCHVLFIIIFFNVVIITSMMTVSALASALVGNWGWFLGMMLSMLLLIGLIIFFIVLFKRGKRFKQHDSPSSSYYGGDSASYTGRYADSKLCVHLPVLLFPPLWLAYPPLSPCTLGFCSRIRGWTSA